MSDKPADIPEDAWQSALACLSGAIEREPEGIRISKTLLIGTVEATARAIMAATERAALIAETHMLGSKHVAAAIRQGVQPPKPSNDDFRRIPHNGEIA